MSATKIEWTAVDGHEGYTFNPWSGCSKISAGCAHCYAANLPPGMRRGAKWGPNADRIPAAESGWAEPRAWNRKAQKLGVRLRVFCASTADVFEDRADLDPWRERLWQLINDTPHLDWLLLTKRPHVMAAWAKTHPWPVNAWAGTSVEDQSAADIRIPDLLTVPARVRFLSCEPLLGEVNITPYLSRLQWVIVGGESGHKARPMRPKWAYNLATQCQEAKVPFFFKQWGEWAPAELDADGNPAPVPANVGKGWWSHADHWYEGEHHTMRQSMTRVGKSAAGRLLEGIEHNGQPV